MDRAEVLGNVMARMELLGLNSENPALYAPVFEQCGVRFDGFEDTPIEAWDKVRTELEKASKAEPGGWDLVWVIAMAIGLGMAKL